MVVVPHMVAIVQLLAFDFLSHALEGLLMQDTASGMPLAGKAIVQTAIGNRHADAFSMFVM